MESRCPHCGYCPHCGRSNFRPYNPYYPWTHPFPYTVTWQTSNPVLLGTGGQNPASQSTCKHEEK